VTNIGNGTGNFSVLASGANASPSSGTLLPGQGANIRVTGQGCPRDYATTVTVLPGNLTVSVLFTP
jgi:hypothetical protein